MKGAYDNRQLMERFEQRVGRYHRLAHKAVLKSDQRELAAIRASIRRAVAVDIVAGGVWLGVIVALILKGFGVTG